MADIAPAFTAISRVDFGAYTTVKPTKWLGEDDAYAYWLEERDGVSVLDIADRLTYEVVHTEVNVNGTLDARARIRAWLTR